MEVKEYEFYVTLQDGKGFKVIQKESTKKWRIIYCIDKWDIIDFLKSILNIKRNKYAQSK